MASLSVKGWRARERFSERVLLLVIAPLHGSGHGDAEWGWLVELSACDGSNGAVLLEIMICAF